MITESYGKVWRYGFSFAFTLFISIWVGEEGMIYHYATIYPNNTITSLHHLSSNVTLPFTITSHAYLLFSKFSYHPFSSHCIPYTFFIWKYNGLLFATNSYCLMLLLLLLLPCFYMDSPLFWCYYSGWFSCMYWICNLGTIMKKP